MGENTTHEQKLVLSRNPEIKITKNGIFVLLLVFLNIIFLGLNLFFHAYLYPRYESRT